jgi:hypothetical protein
LKSAKQSTSVSPGKSVTVAFPVALSDFSVKNITAGTLWLMLFNAAALPANATAAKRCWEIGAGQTYEWDSGSEKLPLDTGLVLAISTTDATLTITLTDDAIIDAGFFFS